MTIGSFTLIKNEILWIRDHLEAWLPLLDQIVFFDGNSTDGTYEVLSEYKEKYPHKLLVAENTDPHDLQDDYVRLFNGALRCLDTDFAFYIHPDMFPIGGEENLKKLDTNTLAYTVNIRSFAGNPGNQLYELEGRAKAWKTIMRLKPDFGLHYYGHYGSAEEDMYFSEITGDQHQFHKDFDKYPYTVRNSGIEIAHFSDVRPFERRLERMKRCLLNQGYNEIEADYEAHHHPRVTLKSARCIHGDFRFKPVKDPRKEPLNV